MATKGCDAIAVEPASEPNPPATFGLDGMDSPGDYFTDGRPTAEEGMEELSRWADEQLAGHGSDDGENDVFDDLF